MRLLLLGELLFCATLAEAQEAGRAPLGPAAAQRMSLVAFLVPLVIGSAMILPENASDEAVTAGSVIYFAGALMGPATGYWLGGAAGRGWLGVAIRGGALALTVATVAGDDDIAYGGAEVAAVGVLGILGHGVYDVIRVRSIVGRRQAELGLAPSPGWVRAPGLGLQLSW